MEKLTALIGSGQTHSKNNQSDISELSFTEILPVIQGNNNGQMINGVSAKALHEALGVGRDFSTWIDRRIAEYGFIEGVDFLTFDSPEWGNQNTENEQWTSKRGGDRRSKDYFLSLGMAKELGMVERTEQGRLIRLYFIECERRLKAVAPEEHKAALMNWRKNRVTACEDHKSMADAMKGYIGRTGDNQKGFAYSNESRFINKLVLGTDPIRWAKNKGIKSKEVRDSMTTEQLQLLAYLESRNCTLLDLDTPTEKRKAQLTELAQRWLAQRMEFK
ncbi:phage antirepressor Ant [Xenorhabdus nematophila]|uniref:phage antirepressor Ant n=1 Tax=Xenorhabdus nematophila TaxID=628 RepID=UPI00032757D2|nr:phage antirepressor Ant [Xenorhabdus nematophila]CCW31778.1 putative anti-repressor protein [Xenorhabdus nematophila F1]